MLLSIGLDHAISRGIAHAKQSKTLAHLLIIQKTLISLIDRTADQFSGTGGTSTGTAGVGEIDAGFFCCIER